MSMNMRNLVMYASDTLVSVKVGFGDNSGRTYTYIAEKILAETLKKDDYVVLGGNPKPTFRIAKVISVDDFVDINPKSDMEFNWVIQKIDTQRIDQLETDLAEQAKNLETKQRKAYRQQILDQMANDDSLVLLTGEPSEPVEKAPAKPATKGKKPSLIDPDWED